ncbi:MAG: putative Ig domain-containing protein, partial [Gammaproteobacteria bacterium]|nr:putative Ig domain-containing protein [Gammaproteobacteria bacterium]
MLIQQSVVIGFEQATYEVREDVGQFDVCVAVRVPPASQSFPADGSVALNVSTISQTGNPTYTADDTDLTPISGQTLRLFGNSLRRDCVSVSITDDAIREGSETFALQLQFAVAGANVDVELAPALAEVTIVASDHPAVRLEPTALSVDEGNMTVYTVALATVPTGDVTVRPEADASGKVSVAGALTFSTTDWNTAQTVTITASEDVDNTTDTATISHVVTGYGMVTAGGEVTVTVTDQRSVPSFGEAMVADQTYDVDAAIPPLTLPVATGGDNMLTYTLTGAVPAGLTYTQAARTLTGTPTAVASAVRLTYTVTDTDTNTVDDEGSLTFAVTIVPVPKVILSVTDLPVREGGSATYTVVLATVPTGAVVVTPSVRAPAGEVSVSGALTFSTTDWSTARTVTVTAAQESVSDTADDTATITHAVTGYGNVTAADVVVTVADDEADDEAPSFGSTMVPNQTYPATVAIPALTLPEASGGNGLLSYTLRGVLPAGLARTDRIVTGTPTTVASAVTLTWVALDDDSNMAATDEGSLTFAMTVTAPPGLTLTPTALTVEEATTNVHTYTVALTTVPTGEVTVQPTPDGSGRVNVQPGALTFTTATWSTAQAVTVTALIDADANEDTATISHTVTGYGRVTAGGEVTVIIPDTDNAPVFVVAAVAAQTYTAGVEIPTLILPGATGGDVALTYALTGSIPAELTFNENAMTLSGTPTTPVGMAVTLTWTVSDLD